MLVHCVQVGESFTIECGPDTVVVTVVDVVEFEGRVKLGFDAPKHVIIDREEVRDNKQRIKRQTRMKRER